MSTSDIKLKIFRKIFRKIDSLKEQELNEFNGIFSNFINSKLDISEWDSLSIEQREGIIVAINQIEAGKGYPHKKVITKFKKKHSDA